jgi:hypothetical protein
MERIALVTIKARLSGVDRQVLDAIVLKVLCGRSGCVPGRATVQTIAEAVERTQQAVRLSLKRLAGLGIVQLSYTARRAVSGVQIHHGLFTGGAAPVDNPETYPQPAASAKKIFRSPVLPSPPKPPTPFSTNNLNSAASRTLDPVGNAAPAARRSDSIWTDALPDVAASGAARPRHDDNNGQGIQQRDLSPPLWAG